MIHPAANIIEDAHACAGLILNCMLLYAIRRFTRKSLGSYKQLLTIFASFDCFLIILHAVVQPHIIIVDLTLFGNTGIFEDRRITAFYAACFTIPFALLNIHFLYRFWSIRYPHLIALFSNKKFITLMAVLPVAELAVWYLMCHDGLPGEEPSASKDILIAEYQKRYGRVVTDGWFLMNHWENGEFNMRVSLVTIAMDVLMFGSFAVASTFAYLIFYYIKRTETISQQAKVLQFKLYISVCAQTFVPLVCVYIPYFLVVNFPFFHLPVYFFDHGCMLLTSCFPAWDAVVIIMLMKEYREGLIGMVKKKKPVAPSSVWMTTSSMMTSATTTTGTGNL